MKPRKGINPVAATVILIAITLTAAIAIAGFVFGLFGSFTSPSSDCKTPLPQIVTSSMSWNGHNNLVVHNGTNPDGSQWVSFGYCNYDGYSVTGHGWFANNTEWWQISH